MSVAVKVVSIGKGGGASELAKYISERERHPDREGKARELFGETVDGLKDKSASRHLTGGKSNEAQKKDVFHLVISPEASEFERSGTNNRDRKEVYKEATRSTMKRLEKEVGATELRWVAAIHLNTKTPHIHVLIHKDFDSEGKERRFHRVPNLDTRSTPKEKLFHTQFANHLEEAIQKGRIVQEVEWNKNWKYPDARTSYEPGQDVAERTTLGRALLAKEFLSGRSEQKFEIKGVVHSEESVQQSIKAQSWQATLWTYTKEGIPGLEKITKGIEQVNRTLQKVDEVTNAPFIKLEKYLDKRERELIEAIQNTQAIQAIYNAQEKLEDWYREKSKPLLDAIAEKKQAFNESLQSLGRPEIREAYSTIHKAEVIQKEKPDIGAAILNREEMGKLQEIYWQHGDAEGLKRLEEIRVTYAYENKQETRTIAEMERLEGQYLVMEASRLIQQPDESFKVMETIVQAEREKYQERGIHVTPKCTPQEREFIERVGTVTGNQHLLEQFSRMEQPESSFRAEVRDVILSHHYPEVSKPEDIPLTITVAPESLPRLAEREEFER